jgi:cyclin C
MYNIKHFPTDNSKLAEMEFYLVDDLECDLTIFHPYRSLFALCKKESEEPAAVDDNEPGAFNATNILSGNALGLGVGVDDGARYWGTGEGKLELSAGALQTAWYASPPLVPPPLTKDTGLS